MKRRSRIIAMIMTLLLLLPTTIFPSIAANGAIWTSDIHSSQDANVDYESKLDVYVNAENFEPGNYWIRVVAPNGTELGRSTSANFVIGEDGEDVGNTVLEDSSMAYQLWSLVNKVSGGVVSGEMGYNDTTNAGGEYKVEVADNSDFTGKKSDNFKVTTEQYGSLEVSKSVVHSDPEGTLPSEMPDFEIMVTGPKGFSETIYLTDGESQTLSDLVPGTYYISETEPTGNYSFVSINGSTEMTEVEVMVAEHQTATAEVINRYTPDPEPVFGALKVSKTVVHSDPEGTLPAEMPDFEIMVTGPEDFSETLYLTNGESQTLSELMPGTYFISETAPTGNYSFVSINDMNEMTEVEILVAENQTAEVEVVNRYTPDPEPGFGALHICKWVIHDEGVKLPDEMPDFEVLVTGPNGFSETVLLTHNEAVTLNSLEPGTYFVSETEPTGEYSFETINLTATMTNYEVVVVENETARAEIVNKYTPEPDPEYGSLLICKWVIHDDPEGMLPTEMPDFEIIITGPNDYSRTIHLSHDESETINNLVPGTYYVSETAPTAPYSFISINDTEEMTDVEVVVAENQEAKAEVVNKYTPTDDPEDPTGAIEIMKFRDYNSDGIKNGSDYWLNNIQFRLEAAPELDTFMAETSEPEVWTMTTGSGDFENGQIIFSGLPYGRYKLVELSSYTITAPEDLKDGEMYVWVPKWDQSEMPQTVYVEVGNYWSTSTRRDRDPDPDPDPDPGKISIFKFLDSNESGSFDTNEFPMENIVFQLFDSNKDMLESASTDTDGMIEFNNLEPGTYFIKEVRQNYTITTPGFDDDGYYEVDVDEDETVLIEVGNYRETIPGDPVPLGPPVVEDVVLIEEEDVPLALPQTGELPPYSAYAIGSLMILAGVFMRRKSI